MILMIKRYLSAYNEYCEVSVEGPYINMKLRIGNRESGTGNWFLVPYLTKRLGYFKTVTGNRKLVPYFGILYYCFKSANQEKGTSSRFLFNYNFVYTSFWVCLFHQHVRH